MPPKKYLGMNGGKLTAEEIEERIKKERKSTMTDPAPEPVKTPSKSSLPEDMFNLSLNTVVKAVGVPKHKSEDELKMDDGPTNHHKGATRGDWGAEDEEDVFLENDPTAPILDGGSPDVSMSFFNEMGVSPPKNNPLLAANTILQSFEGAVLTAQKEVTKEASEAIEEITRNLREVESRSLKCLEREMAVGRREARLDQLAGYQGQKRPRGLNWMEEMERNGIVRISNPKRPRYGEAPKVEMIGRITNYNKRGKPYFTYVDDTAVPAVLRSRPDYTLVPYMPWLHKGMHRLQARSAAEKRGRGDNDDWRWDDPRTGRGPGGYKKKKDWRKFNQPATDTCRPKGGQNPNHHDDEDEGGPPRYQGRGRCHSNVMIEQNVRVNH